VDAAATAGGRVDSERGIGKDGCGVAAGGLIEEAAAARHGVVAGQGGILHAQRRAAVIGPHVGDAAAHLGGDIAQQGGADDRQFCNRPAAIVDYAAAPRRDVGEEGAVLDH